EVVVRHGREAIRAALLDPAVLEIVLRLADDVAALRAVEIADERRDAAEVTFDVGVLVEGERLDRHAMLLRRVAVVRDRRRDRELEGALAGLHRLFDVDDVRLVVDELAAVLALFERPVEAVVLQLIVGVLRAKERPKRTPALD